ncbi:MAG: DUF4287 domain-containing protein, partial [Pseudomonadota bacterium]
IIENLSGKTGHPLSHWLKVLDGVAEDNATRMAHLKQEHGIGHHTANAIVREMVGDVPWAAPDALEASLRGQIAPGHQGLYDALRDHLTALDGVQMVPCRTYTGFKARRQFAVVKPSKADGLHIGMALPLDADAGLEPAKSLGSERITARATAALGAEKILALLELAAERDKA